MAMNLLPFVTPVIKQIAPVITEKIKNKISPSELQQAMLAGIELAELEEKKLPIGQNLFFRSKPDGVTGVSGFLEKFLNIAGVQNELAKSFNNQGLADVDYLEQEFNRTVEEYKEVNPIKDRIKPWLTVFTQTYFQETSTYLKFQVSKQNYFKQLNKRYDNIKFAGIAVSGQEEVKELQKIFVMPDVAKIEQNTTSLPEEFIAEELSRQEQIIVSPQNLGG